MRSRVHKDGLLPDAGCRRPFRESTGSINNTNSARNINDENAPPPPRPPPRPPSHRHPTTTALGVQHAPCKTKHHHHHSRYLKHSRVLPLNVHQEPVRTCQEQGASASDSSSSVVNGPTVASSTCYVAQEHGEQTQTPSPRLPRRRRNKEAWEGEGAGPATSETRKGSLEGRIPLHVSQDVRVSCFFLLLDLELYMVWYHIIPLCCVVHR